MNVTQLLTLEELSQYKVHLASWNGEARPLDVFVRDRDEWLMWNTWRSSKDDFNRAYILALVEFHPDPGMWLFGGVFKVLARSNVNRSHSYTVELTDQSQDLIGRLKIRFARSGRAKAIRLENYVDQFIVEELFKEPYSGRVFPGYENVTLEFNELDYIISACRPDWRAALMNVKGVYVIFDRSNGMKYVGSAYGDTGIWSRWSCYVRTGHGFNDELTKLIDEHGLDYARQHFRISLLEYRPARTDDRVIIERECYWKEALLSRFPNGYNRN
jgi:hypothetical protein